MPKTSGPRQKGKEKELVQGPFTLARRLRQILLASVPGSVGWKEGEAPSENEGTSRFGDSVGWMTRSPGPGALAWDPASKARAEAADGAPAAGPGAG